MAAPATDTDTEAGPLDWHIFSVRDFLAVVHGVRQERRRGDVLRMLEDALLDLVGDEA